MLKQRNFCGRIGLLAAFVLAVLLSHSALAIENFPLSTLTISSAEKNHSFSVELATTAKQQSQGLMFRRKMAAGSGMVFVYARAQPISMWMKNTLIPLDMIFIGDSGKISHIVERTTPMSRTIISSGGPIRGVLELNGGTVSRLKLQVGDRVVLKDVFPV
ncbi:MAG: DUF192 domain-containing protein [Alphaproteobacteria bacterium]|nr:DUF192 domain-containing protein [Alphaproteobacteria bacterium]